MSGFRQALRRSRLTVAAAMVLSLVVSVFSGVPAVASPVRPAPPPPAHLGPAVHGVHTVASGFVKPVEHAKAFKPTATTWPTAATASIVLTPPSGQAKQGPQVRGAGTPVWAAAVARAKNGPASPSAVNVRVRDQATAHAADVNGVLLDVMSAGTGGPVRVGVDYGSFAQAYGGNYGSRLRLVTLPACALSTPKLAKCRRTSPLPSTNDPATHMVSALVNVPAATGTTATTEASSSVVLAAVADAGQDGGPAGTYAATSLKPSGSWSEGGSSGSFTYSYPIAVPPASSSLVPAVGLSYDSASLDGQTATTWAQSSWVGDGWSTPSSFIEQTFVSCSDDPEGTASPASTGDMCYDGPVLTMSLNGASTSLVWDSTKQVWKAQDDSGDVITHVTNSGNGSGTFNTDYWTVTTRDGTRYSFGLNHLPGWSSGKPATNSVDSEPVYSAHPTHTLEPGESADPCYKSSGFADSVCTMAYRWNLDYVTDVHGDAMAYYYRQDTNFYGENKGASNVSYVRDSHLDHIDYGFTNGNAYGTVPDSVVFTPADRCVSGTCDPLNASTKANWPDVPYDLVCAQGATCQSWSPSFFSTVRLASITTKQYSGSAPVNVDSYALTQTLPTTLDSTSPTLWLSSITHTGWDTTAGGSTQPITLPSMTFTSTPLANRVDTVTDGYPPMYRYRIKTITTETGSVITPTYTLLKPCAAPVTLSPASNTSSCYPVYWTPDGASEPFLDWFNKYVVTEVDTTAPNGGIDGQPAVHITTVYRYPDKNAGWHYDDNEVVKAKYRTYGQFRGYDDVQTLTGDPGELDPQTLSEATYYRGMSQDNNSTVVNLTDSAGGVHEDLNQLAGTVLESTSYLGDGGPVDHSTITSYWVSAATASRSRTGLPALTANWVAQAETYTRQALTDGGSTTWRYTETDSSYDATPSDATFGLATHIYTHTVPTNPAYDQCATMTYAPVNTAKNLIGLVSEAETDSVACGGFTEGTKPSVPAALNTLAAPASMNRPDQVISDARTFYDDPTFSTTFPQPAAPTKGDVTMVRKASGYTGGAFTYQTSSRSTYDSYGRVLLSWDANDNETTTSYTVNSVGLTTGTTVTNALNQSASITLDPLTNATLTSTDANGVVTTSQYDALGRVTAVWLDNRPTSAPANYLYTYLVQTNGGVTAVTTKKMNDSTGYQTSITMYDGQLRPRQTQTDTPQNGRLVTDTFYDSHGWVTYTNNGWWDPNTVPNTTVIAPTDLSNNPGIPSQNYYTYDGLGRTVVNTSEHDNQPVTSTTTVYNGDRTTVIPPQGGITQSTVTDPLGRTTELDQYTSLPTLHTPGNTFTGVWYLTGGATNVTTYGYDGHGNQNTISDTAGNTWKSTYNLLGQVTIKSDPDAGTPTAASLYDNNGNLTQTTDSLGNTISYTYDPLNRKTGEYDAPISSQSTANQLASWVYDNSNNVAGVTNPIGHLTTETSYYGGAAYVNQATGFNIFGESLGQTITIPAAEGGLAGSYVFTHTYSTTTGRPSTDGYPAAGGIPKESVLHTYTVMDLPSGFGSYGHTTSYDPWGRISQETIGSSPNFAYLTDQYDTRTGQLTDQKLTRAVTQPGDVDDEHYVYDNAGNITKQISTRLGATTPTETQCYTYDNLDRLTTAWTATDSCAATPTSTNHSTVGDSLGTTSAYWTSWSFTDPLGQRDTQIQHALNGGSDTKTNYQYNGNNTNQPHTLTSTTTSGASTGITSYSYNTAGNMATRTAAQGTQTMHWDHAGRLAAISGGTGGDTSYEYDADGNLLIEKDPGSTTLYLPNEQITLNTTTNTTTGVRYYPLPGGGTAVRTGGSTNFTFEITDQHGTPTVYLDHTAQNPTWRQYTPYGDPRGGPPAWLTDNRGFLNKPTNTTTGLAEMGARNYDTTIGQFISLDPLLEPTDPQQLNGYTYANNNPINNSDPNGTACVRLDTDGPCIKNVPPPPPSPSNNDGDGDGGACRKCIYVGPVLLPDTPETENMKKIYDKTFNAHPEDYQDPYYQEGLVTKICEEGNLVKGKSGTCAYYGILQDLSNQLWNLELPDVIAAEAMVTIVGEAVEISVTEASGVVDRLPLRDLPDAQKQIIQKFDDDVSQGALCPTLVNRNSFRGSTLVLLANGKAKPIQDVMVGDVVLTTDPATGKTTPERVTDLHLNQDTELTDLTVANGGVATVIHTTQHHPFWDDTQHAWVDATNLHPGDRLHTPDGETETVTAVRSFIQQHLMYNLTINSTHTYYVIAAATPILVHNACSGTSGHTAAAGNGTAIHGDFSNFLNDMSADGYSGARTLPSGNKIDGAYADPVTGQEIPIELKPNNSSQIRKGWNQLAKYEREMGAPAGSGQLWVYDVAPGGEIYYTRVF